MPVGDDSDIKLIQEFWRIIRQLMLKPTLPARVYDGAGGGNHAVSTPPLGAFDLEAGHYEAERLIERWNRAKSLEGQERVVEAAREELRSWRRVADQTQPAISLVQLVIEDGEGYSAEQVGQRYRLSFNHVRRLRIRAGRSPEDGRVVGSAGKNATPDERRREIMRLKARNLSLRQIAFVVGCKPTTVHEDLRRLKAAA